MTTKLIINADDFGPNPAVCAAIIAGFNNGIISSTSVIINFQESLENIKPLIAKQYPCGVHLNIHSGKPVSNTASVKTLVDKNDFFKLYTSLNHAKNEIDPHELKIEFRHQIETLLSQQICVTHIDNHRSDIYFIPEHFQIVIELAKEFQLPIRLPFARNYQQNLYKYTQHFSLNLQETILNAEKLRNYAISLGVKFPDEFSLLDSEKSTTLPDTFNSLTDGTYELCTHPSLGADAGKKELAMLVNYNKDLLLSEFGIELTDFRGI